MSLVLAAGHVVGGVLAAFYAAEWDDENLNDNLEHVQRSLIASAVSSCSLLCHVMKYIF